MLAERPRPVASHREVDSPFFLPLALGFAVEGTSGSLPRVFFEETVLPGRSVGAGQAEAYVLCSLATSRDSPGTRRGRAAARGGAVTVRALATTTAKPGP